MKTVMNSLKFELSNPAKFRLHVLTHYYQYGYKSTTKAFKIGKSTLYDWKKKYEKSNKKLISLVPKKTKPKRFRCMTTDYRLVEFIKSFRKQYGNIGREKIKVFLDQYAKEINISSISSRTISKVIKRKNLFNFNKKNIKKRKTRFKKYRVKKSPKVNQPGFIEVDCIIVYINGIRHNFVSIIDIYTKVVYVKKIKTISSLQTTLALKEFQQFYYYKIKTIQTDNGSEFFLHFHQYLVDNTIKHQFTYPRSPKINGVVERFNRTIQEEFINRNDEIYYDLDKFEIKLKSYLNWYNYKRPHASLNYLSPMQFIKTINFPESGCL